MDHKFTNQTVKHVLIFWVENKKVKITDILCGYYDYQHALPWPDLLVSP